MKLLFDQNLSRSLVQRLADLFPGSIHVAHHALEAASDGRIWQIAAQHDLVLATKDGDFHDEAKFPGPPPKCIILGVGNSSTGEVEDLIRRRIKDIDAFEANQQRVLPLNS